MNLIYDPWTEEFANKIFSVLVTHAGAKEHDRDGFVYSQTHRPVAKEWRFIGTLSFGGKMFRGTRERRIYVSYYEEHQTPERDLVVERCNIALQVLVDEELDRQSQESSK